MPVTGSRCSSDGSTTSSRDRCRERASDSLSPVAREVDSPQAVLVLIPAVSETDSLVPREVPVCPDRDRPPPRGMTPAPGVREYPVPSEVDSLSLVDEAAETESPAVLV
jgi:hypothetical protein